jgi:molecular chaperone HtpG
MVADRVDVFSRRAGTDEMWLWSSDGKGSFTVVPVPLEAGPAAVEGDRGKLRRQRTA